MTVTKNGYTKLVRKEEFFTKEGKVKKRAQKGLMAVKLGKDDFLSVAVPVELDETVYFSTEKGRVLKLIVDQKRIPVAKRTAMGDPVLKIEGDYVVRAVKPKIKSEENDG